MSANVHDFRSEEGLQAQIYPEASAFGNWPWDRLSGGKKLKASKSETMAALHMPRQICPRSSLDFCFADEDNKPGGPRQNASMEINGILCWWPQFPLL